MKSILSRHIQISVRVSVAQLLLAVATLLFATYLGWELYWFQKIGLYFIKWHTHLVFTALLFAALLFTPIYLFSFFRQGDSRKKAWSIAISVWLVFLFLELALLVLGWNKTYNETRSGYYRSPFEPEAENTYHIYHPNDSLKVTAPEFSYVAHYNSLGFPGKEWPTEKSNRNRIVTLGDSFTEGDGAPMDSTYPAQLQNILGDSFEILNAGVRGSDPVFGVKIFEDQIAAYQPDLVLQTISENDVLFDMCIRGGYERFLPDSTVRFASPPWWEPIYAMSYVSRIFFHAFGFDMSEPCGNTKSPAFVAQQNELLKDVLNRFEATAAANNTPVLIVFFPTKFEVFRNAYDFDYTSAKQHINTLPHVSFVDLFDCYRSKINNSGKPKQDFYWVIDGHHNPRGYGLMASCVAEAIWHQQIDLK
ncbi:MAG: hypothetical protein JNK66_05370 [Chitinophagales bacterium]|nr:hypothetical protein [Chitinophagales bacterium]